MHGWLKISSKIPDEGFRLEGVSQKTRFVGDGSPIVGTADQHKNSEMDVDILSTPDIMKIEQMSSKEGNASH